MSEEHKAVRPSWACASCGKPWPCVPAREQLASELTGTWLTMYMSIDMIDAARDDLSAKPGELYERFVAWTRQPAAG